ncbi:DUF6671 family protein [Devosia sp.]|uniref:DUF6671 family protein n=1 Tax=Devosia sp. TaxID=1871048 RepID=UPI003BABC651
MSPDWSSYFNGKSAVLATMHGKEAAIAPTLAKALGLDVMVPADLDTDQFGSFSREVPRKGSQLDAARAKIAAGFALVPGASVGIASEGTFGPHPAMPIVPQARELILLVDRLTGLELLGEDVSLETNYAHQVVSQAEDALSFAIRCGFPEHGIVVSACVDGAPDPTLGIDKSIVDENALVSVTTDFVGKFGTAFVETDMRAYRNPTRMQVIARAAADLVSQFKSRCPSCGYPGFRVVKVVRGLECGWCGEPTSAIRSRVSSCASCGHTEEIAQQADSRADPSICELCNP